MRFLVLGDPHVKIDALPEIDELLSKVVQLLSNIEVDYIVLLGDILHTHERLHTIALNKAIQLIQTLASIKPVYVLVGNHDMVSNQEFLNENHWMNGAKHLPNVTIVDKVVTLKVDKKEFYIFCPYVFPGRFIEALETGKVDYRKATCIFAHQEFFNCKMGAIVSVDGDKWPIEYPFVISGHIHSKQSPQGNIFYPGSSLQIAFGESSKNIVLLASFNGKDRVLDEIDLGLPRKEIIYKDVSELDSLVLPTEHIEKKKITLSGNYQEFQAVKATKRYKELVKSGAKIVFKQKKTETEYSKQIGDESDFKKILKKLVDDARNPMLSKYYEEMVNGNIISEDDLLFLD